MGLNVPKMPKRNSTPKKPYLSMTLDELKEEKKSLIKFVYELGFSYPSNKMLIETKLSLRSINKIINANFPEENV